MSILFLIGLIGFIAFNIFVFVFIYQCELTKRKQNEYNSKLFQQKMEELRKIEEKREVFCHQCGIKIKYRGVNTEWICEKCRAANFIKAQIEIKNDIKRWVRERDKLLKKGLK